LTQLQSVSRTIVGSQVLLLGRKVLGISANTSLANGCHILEERTRHILCGIQVRLEILFKSRHSSPIDI
jgi:hypothetical protein